MDPGTRLGHYEILAPLGAGGMGEVYRARDTNLKRDVAIKVLPEALAADQERLARLEREAHLLAALNHVNIASIHSLERAADTRFLVLELVEGETLAERLKRGALPVEEALAAAKQIAEALEAAHEEGIIHRDLKPANVMLTPAGNIKVLDFGLAKGFEVEGVLGDATNSPTITVAATRSGVIQGTAAYMSPEQTRGQPLDKRTDIWSFGCVLFEMLTGHMAFGGDTVPDVLAAIVKEQPTWGLLPQDTPPRVQTLLRRCLNKKAHMRLRDIGDARLELAEPVDEQMPTDVVGRQPTGAWKALPWGIAATLAIGWAATAYWPGQGGVPAESVRVEMRISRDVLNTTTGSAVALSPTGGLLAYVTRPADFTEIHVRPLRGLGGTLVAAGTGIEAPYNPFFSPDGTSVGYATPFEIRRVPVSGGPATAICEVSRSRGASWGDRGTIAVAIGTDTGLFRIGASGGNLEPLTTLAEDERSHRWPHFLPDERAVLFVAWRGDPDETPLTSIDVFDPSTGRRSRLVEGGTAPSYAPSGHLVYVDGTTMMAAPFDVERLLLTGEAVPVARDVHANENEGGVQYSISRTGTLVYRSSDALFPQYSAILVDSSGASAPFLPQPETYGSPEFSPDGAHVAMTVFKEGNWDVWVYEIGNEATTQLTFHRDRDVAPIWSHDGETIYFASRRASVVNNIWHRPADGSGEAELLRSSPYAETPSHVSPDGRYLMIYQQRQRGGYKDLLLVDLEDPGQPRFRAQWLDRGPRGVCTQRTLGRVYVNRISARRNLRSSVSRG